MPIITNSGPSYAGANSIIQPPITGDDCGVYPTFTELVTAEQQPGRGCTIRAGKAWASRTTAQIAASCTLPPQINSYNYLTSTLTGLRFGTKTGPAQLEANTSGSWFEVATSTWNDTTIVHDGPGFGPSNKLRVTDSHGTLSNEYTIP